MQVITYKEARARSSQAKALGNDFGWAYWSLIARDIIGDAWLAEPMTQKELGRRMTRYSDYGASYWTTEPKGSYGVARCHCGERVKRKYPWFGAKHC